MLAEERGSQQKEDAVGSLSLHWLCLLSTETRNRVVLLCLSLISPQFAFSQ